MGEDGDAVPAFSRDWISETDTFARSRLGPHVGFVLDQEPLALGAPLMATFVGRQRAVPDRGPGPRPESGRDRRSDLVDPSQKRRRAGRLTVADAWAGAYAMVP